MKYKVGDRVKIQSLERYNKYKNRNGDINYGCETEILFTSEMSSFCGQVVTITRVRYIGCVRFYHLAKDKGDHLWVDGMFEGLAEEENNPKFKKGDCVKCSDGSIGIIVTCDWSDSLNCYQYYVDYIGTLDAGYQPEKDLQPHTITTMNGRDIFEGAKWKHEFECPDGYIFRDENGNVINATKLVLEKKKGYPKTYEECRKIMDIDTEFLLTSYDLGFWKEHLLTSLQKLLICRDAYWKIAGDDMGLGKPWKPDYDSGVDKYGIICMNGVVQESNPTTNWERHLNKVLDFPTAEMRDAFYENFEVEIKSCKELL